MSEPIIRTRGLTRRFGDFTAVDSLDLTVEPGSIFAFLGGNGSGKSTTIRMLIGLLRPTAGEVMVEGVDVVSHPRRVRDRIGYMGQKVSLYAGLSLRENVEFYAGLYGIGNGGLEARWGQLRERFDLAHAERELSEALPAGIRQRAGLALAMLHDPKLIFLDEPTAGVDVRSRTLFWEVIQEEAAAGVTVFVTTHFLEEVEYCHWVSFIEAGRLVADATPEALRAQFSAGYRIVVPRPDDAVAARLRDAGATVQPADGGGLVAGVPQLTDAVLDAVATLPPDAGTHIEQPDMPAIFRSILLRAKEERAA